MSEIEQLREMVLVLMAGWTVEKVTIASKGELRNEDPAEAWLWDNPQENVQHIAPGDWSKLPPWPQSAHEAFVKVQAVDLPDY